jgi:hypothetical protein
MLPEKIVGFLVNGTMFPMLSCFFVSFFHFCKMILLFIGIITHIHHQNMPIRLDRANGKSYPGAWIHVGDGLTFKFLCHQSARSTKINKIVPV